MNNPFRHEPEEDIAIDNIINEIINNENLEQQLLQLSQLDHLLSTSEPKPLLLDHLYQIPTLENQKNEYDFLAKPAAKKSTSGVWHYSKKMNYLFTEISNKKGELIEVPFKVSYKTNGVENEQLQVRFIAVYTEDNFKNKPIIMDPEHYGINAHFIECNYDYGQVEYHGYDNEINYGSRHSVTVSMPKNSETVEKFVRLRFKCLNSDFVRQGCKLAIIVALENAETKEILAQNFINLKVCENATRDKKAMMKKLGIGVRSLQRRLYKLDAQPSTSQKNRGIKRCRAESSTSEDSDGDEVFDIGTRYQRLSIHQMLMHFQQSHLPKSQ